MSERLQNSEIVGELICAKIKIFEVAVGVSASCFDNSGGRNLEVATSMPVNFLIQEPDFWGATVESILNDIKNNDPLHSAYLSVLGTGSYYEGTDNKQWSDFDLMLVMGELTISWWESISVPPSL